MTTFLLVFLCVYGLMNFYCFWKVSHVVLVGNLTWQIAFGVFLCLMVFGPIIVRSLERAEFSSLAYCAALVAYSWMAVLLWFDFVMIVLDLWNLVILCFERIWTPIFVLGIPPKPAFAAVVSLVFCAAVASIFEARSLNLDEVTIKSVNYKSNEPLRILQISDVHIGLIERERRLQQISSYISQTNPDLILSTGDLVDGMGDNLNRLHSYFVEAKPRLGKYAVTGNHDFYAGIAKSVSFHEQSGFKLLRGASVDIDNGQLRLVGVDDPTQWRYGFNGKEDEGAILGARRPGQYTILLKHQPKVDPNSLGKFDLMLSGHTHRGQIFPFGMFVKTVYRYLSGTYKLQDGSVLHVSRGTGTWGPPMRLFAQPEVTLIMVEPIL